MSKEYRSYCIIRVNQYGSLAQLVEQRLEEPCVPSSSLGGATKIISSSQDGGIILVIIPRLELGTFAEGKIVPSS